MWITCDYSKSGYYVLFITNLTDLFFADRLHQLSVFVLVQLQVLSVFGEGAPVARSFLFASFSLGVNTRSTSALQIARGQTILDYWLAYSLRLGPRLLAEVVEIVKKQIHIFLMIGHQMPLHLGVVLYFYFGDSRKLGVLGFERVLLEGRRGESIIAFAGGIPKLSVASSGLEAPFSGLEAQSWFRLFLKVILPLRVLDHSS